MLFLKKIFSLTRETAGVCARCARRPCILINFDKIHEKIFRALRAQRALHYIYKLHTTSPQEERYLSIKKLFFHFKFHFCFVGKIQPEVEANVTLVSGSKFIFDPFGRERLSFSKAKSDHPNFFCKNQFSDFKADVLQWR